MREIGKTNRMEARATWFMIVAIALSGIAFFGMLL